MVARQQAEHGSVRHGEAFENDLATLSNSALRKKYAKEANSHRNRKAHAKKMGWTFDPAWADFKDFLRDMGPAPGEGYTLDRIDSDVERYGPGLCRWANKEEQTRNRRVTRFVTFQGDDLPIAEFATRIGVPYKTVHSALSRGETPAEIAARVTGK